jgi:glutamate-1-semialdehyde aminotransferase
MVKEAGLGARIKVIGRSQWSLLKFTEENGTDSPLLKNLFQQEAIKRGVLLLVTHNMTAAHDSSAIHQTLQAYAEAIKTLADWLQDSDPTRFLEGPMSQPVFRVR